MKKHFSPQSSRANVELDNGHLANSQLKLLFDLRLNHCFVTGFASSFQLVGRMVQIDHAEVQEIHWDKTNLRPLFSLSHCFPPHSTMAIGATGLTSCNEVAG